MNVTKAQSSGSRVATDDRRSGAHRDSLQQVMKSTLEFSKRYTLLLGIIAGLPTSASVISDRYHVPMPYATAIMVVPFGLLLAWWIVVRSEQRRKERAIAIGKGEIKSPDYFRLSPYDENSEFRRVDNVHEKIYEWLVNSRVPLLYLMGASGSGKSSIVSGWVMPKLVREDVRIKVVAARVVGNPTQVIRQALLRCGEIWERPSIDEKAGLRELLEKAAKRVAPKRLLLILDQFEEFLILASQEQRDEFTRVLVSLSTSPINGLQLLMILREDYRGQLETLRLPVAARDTMTVPKFFERDAMNFLKASGLPVSDALESEILEEAREVEQAKGLIRPITINLFGLVLRRFHSLPKDYRKGALLRSYLHDVIRRQEIRDIAVPILRSMIIGNSKRPAVRYADIAEEVHIEAPQVRGCLVALANEGIVRELDRESGVWEISHDFIAFLFRPIVDAWKISFTRRHRSWLVCGAACLWLFMTVWLWTNFNEEQQRSELIALGFSNGPCPEELAKERCEAWAASGEVGDGELKKAVLHFKRLKLITSISLSETKITDISPLKELPDLKALDISATQISDVSPLASLRHLQSLNLWGNIEIRNFDALTSLVDLRDLDLRWNKFSDVTKLSNLQKLESLKLAGVGSLRTLVGLNSIGSLKNLRTLDLNAVVLTDIGFLHDLTALENLYLANDAVKDIRPLALLNNLKTLVMDGTRVQDIGALRGLHQLRTLVLADTNVDDIEPLSGLTQLQKLDLGRMHVTELSSLRNLFNLRELNIFGVDGENFDVLEILHIEKLGIDPNHIGQSKSLMNMPYLTEIHVPRLAQGAAFLHPAAVKIVIDYQDGL
ncbi:leucine-rich repeat domain-containing protein [Pararobbsia alpina]|uniref:leucine-rich repeat domain-containing protein n=1 Tax=Pararobbsia alpina TaxID=621374 RepID=UPI0039A4EBD8